MEEKSVSLLLVCILVLQCVTVVFGAAQPTSVTISGVLRDQAPWNMCNGLCSPSGSCGDAGRGFNGTDFQLPIGYYRDDEKDLVGRECNTTYGFVNCGALGVDRTPVYAYTGMSPWKNIQSPKSFYNWFHNSEQTRVVNFDLLIPSGNNNLYSYKNNSFFPLDGRGWKDTCNFHNYGFCFEAHTSFGYYGGEEFGFTGDDDVWVYMAGKLVIDLGSLHTKLSKTLLLDTLPFLVKGNVYPFDFFYCERHTTFSNMEITTSIGTYCTFTDWCGVCNGNGQSCCTQQMIDQYCNDNDPCTVDGCGVLSPPYLNATCTHTRTSCNPANACETVRCSANSTCIRTPINCNDSNVCTTDVCNPTSGCSNTPIPCNDNNACTNDVCDTVRGCSSTPITCDDNNACTNNNCDRVQGCQFPTIVCNPTNKCLNPSCDPRTGCSTANITCNDNNPCTIDTCNPTTGCVYTPKVCDDNSRCTTDACVAGNCVFTPVTCPSTDPCVVPTCVNTTGCQFPPLACAPRPCQTVSCISAQGGCVYRPVVCDDGLKCTNDTCDIVSGACVFRPLNCDDGKACTTESCVPATGACSFSTVTCDDSNKCTNNLCSNTTGCVYPPVNCDDGDSCTTDTCEPATGCAHTPVNCNDANSCTIDTCNPSSGCSYVNRTCNDNNACTQDTCNSISGCQFNDTSALCNSADPCFITSCNPTFGCSRTNRSCDDRDACTRDYCLSMVGCQHEPVPDCTLCNTPPVVNCTPLITNFCFPLVCTPVNGTCIAAPPVVCNDNSMCTDDSCVGATGECSFVAKDCVPADLCLIGGCNPLTGCTTTAKNCDDGNVCTFDSCNAGSCNYTARSCDDGDACTIDTCDAVKGCNSTRKDCNDNDLCTVDSCNIAGNCTHLPFSCPEGNLCQLVACDPLGGCSLSNKSCDDSNPCTKDSCNLATGGCVHDLISTYCLTCGPNACPWTDSCLPQVCNNVTLTCETQSVICDDKNLCTNDSCDGSGPTFQCKATPITCNTADLCNPYICSPTLGCQLTPVSCNDNNFCSDDACVVTEGKATCSYTPHVCPTTDLCNPGVCNATSSACVNVPVNCDDNNPCTIDQCVLGNCSFTKKECGSVCSPAICLSNTTEGLCVDTPLVCDDNNPCTLNVLNCDPVTGPYCTYPLNATQCDDGNICTTDICNFTVPVGQDPCQHSLKTCEANDTCSVALPCDPKAVSVGGCVVKPLECNSSTYCKIRLCDTAAAGCVTHDRVCPNEDIACFLVECEDTANSTTNGTCHQVRRPNFASSYGRGNILCPLLYDDVAIAAAIGAGATAGIVIGAVAAAAILAVGGKKGYDFIMAKQSPIGGVGNNPLYAPSGGSGENPLFRSG